MAHKRFYQLGPAAYAISTAKCRAVRRLSDTVRGGRFAADRSPEPLPVVIYRHNSLIRRRLGQVDMQLQENKAVNLALAAPRVSGILIRPGETFSFWRLVGNPTARRGYREGLTIGGGEARRGVGGGMCQFTNLLHWMVLHTPLEIVEHHHHDGYDLFPDFNRQIPFGTGTSIFYNYLDYRFRNSTDRTYQILVHITDRHLCGELRADAPQPLKYHICAAGEGFVREDGAVWRVGQVWRTALDPATGAAEERLLLRENRARVRYDTAGLEIGTERA